MDPLIIDDSKSRLQTEASEHGCSIEVNYHATYFSLSTDKACRLTWIQNSLWSQVQKTHYHCWRKSAKNLAVTIVLPMLFIK
jgi:hypothetical protein